MNNYKIMKLKKYLFLISILFFIILLTHLYYIFIYNDSKIIAVQWWTISEWLIWEFPSLNPLKPLNWNNKYIINLLYRSLLKYENNKIISDLASCNIDNLLNIECYLKDNIYWSNWDEINIEDIISTYNVLKNTKINNISSSILKNTKIIKNNNIIIFKNKKKDINILNIFFQPIVSKKIIDNIWNIDLYLDFKTHGQIYSWDFEILNISSDLTLWVTKIFLGRNKFNNNWNISKLILQIFPNINSLLKNKQLINIFNDTNNLIWESIIRFKNYKYTLPQYVSIFINQNNIKNINLRTFILNKIVRKNIINDLWDTNFLSVLNPYLNNLNIDIELKNNEYENIFKVLWYQKKDDIINNESNKKIYSNEIKIDLDKYFKESKYILSPKWIKQSNFINSDNILLVWKVDKNTDFVYLNNYKIQNYKKGNSKFYYRLKENFNNIKQWINKYKIYFEINNKKILKEEISFIYFKNKFKLESEKKNFINNLILEKNNKNTKIEISKERLKKISNLNKDLFYNKDLESFNINLAYIKSTIYLEKTAQLIKNYLYDSWINVTLKPIDIFELNTFVQNKNQYDIFLAWINLWNFKHNIFPYFHSSQSENGYNFSNIKKASLDILLEELKINTKNNSKKTKLISDTLNILSKQQIIKVLYSPKINLLIDKNISNVIIPKILTNKSSRSLIYKHIYIKEDRIINFYNKWLINFFKFLLKKIND